MDISKAFGTVNRIILWAALYKVGIHVQTILHIRRGRIKTTLQENTTSNTGKVNNNAGAFQ